MLRWLLIAFIIYLIYRLITGPKKKNQNRPFFRIWFSDASDRKSPNNANMKGKNTEKHLDHIEDAEFEDITEEVTKEKKSEQ